MDAINARRRNVRHNVKSGCLTCKIRKVKCDEGRPSCQRCVSTGRVCDGYGIWGGGGRSGSLRQTTCEDGDQRTIARPPGIVTGLNTDAAGKNLFEWFRHRTASKLPGTFICDFWTSLILQASLAEPAVWHAVLALSAVHKGAAVPASEGTQHLTLQHYNRSINHLRPRLLVKDWASCRVTLITCITFISLELLRGHFQTAQLHFQNGLNILQAARLYCMKNDGSLTLRERRESTDEWILEVFSRLYLQMELLRRFHSSSGPLLPVTRPPTSLGTFNSLNDAWREMEWLFNQIFSLTDFAKDQAAKGNGITSNTTALIDRQGFILTELMRWLDRYQLSITDRTKLYPGLERAYQLLRSYNTMARIMAHTCLHLGDEAQYDRYTEQFVLLIQQLARLYSMGVADAMKLPTPKHELGNDRSIIDLGWIAPLYFVAIKCRVHYVRLQSIRCLELTTHREGLWDARTASCVARKVMETEEQHFYDRMIVREDFSTFDPPTPQDLALPTISESYRIYELDMKLEGTPLNRIRLFGKRKVDGLEQKALHSDYNVFLQRWIDK